MGDPLIAMVVGAVLAALISSLLTGIVTVARIKVHLEWFRSEITNIRVDIARVESSATRAHERIDLHINNHKIT